jgi:hypothetical protein
MIFVLMVACLLAGALALVLVVRRIARTLCSIPASRVPKSDLLNRQIRGSSVQQSGLVLVSCTQN